MFFRAYSLPEKSRAKQIQDLLNEGLTFFDGYVAIGGHFTETSKEALLSQSQYMRRIVEDNESPSLLRDTITQSQRDTAIARFLYLANILSSERAWASCESIIKSESKPTVESKPTGKHKHFLELKSRWFRQVKYAHFTLNAMFTSDKLLKKLDDFCVQGRKLVKGDTAHETYYNYLIELEDQIKKEREKLAEGLFYRLRIACTRFTLTHHQPIPYIIDEMKALSITEFNAYQGNIEMNRSDEPFPFAKVLSYIKAHGSPSMIQIARSYSVLHSSLIIDVIHQGKESYLVPESIKEFIPVKRPFWTRIIPGYSYRYEFIHHKSNVLAKLMQLHKSVAPSGIQSSLHHPYWQHLNELQHILSDELKQADLQKQSIFSFLYPSKNRMLARWTHFMGQEQRRIIAMQIDFLKVYSLNMNMVRHDLDPNDYDIQSELTRIEKNMDTLHFPKDKREFIAIKETILGKRAPHQSNLASALHSFVENNKPLTHQFWSELDHLKRENVDEFKQFIKLNAVYFNALADNINKRIRVLPGLITRNQAIVNICQFLMQAYRLLEQALPHLESETIIAGLKKTIIGSFETYPDYVRELSVKDARAREHSFNVLHQVIFAHASLDQSMDEQKAIYFKADGFFRDHLAGKKPLCLTEDVKRADALCREVDAGIAIRKNEREQRRRHLEFLRHQCQANDHSETENVELSPK